MKLTLIEWVIVFVIVMVISAIVYSHSVRLNESERLLAECKRSGLSAYACEDDHYRRTHSSRTVYIR